MFFDVRKFAAAAVSAVLIFSVAFTGIAEAKDLIRYDGKGIQSKASIKTAKLKKSRSCTVNHAQWPDYPDWKTTMTVSIQKKELFGWSTVGARSFSGAVKEKKFKTHCLKGDYRLYFKSSNSGAIYSVWGRFYY